MTDTANPRRHIPLKPVVLHILLTLMDGKGHGYQIMQTVSERSGRAVEIPTAMLYRTLRRLLDQGLIAEADDRPAPDKDDSRRRYYEITPLGRRVTAIELARLRVLLQSRPATDLLEAADGS